MIATLLIPFLVFTQLQAGAVEGRYIARLSNGQTHEIDPQMAACAAEGGVIYYDGDVRNTFRCVTKDSKGRTTELVQETLSEDE